MWLPTPLYESLPYLYIGVGILFIAGATYIGLGDGESTLYLGTGAVSVLAGAFVYMRRASARANRKKLDPESPDTQSADTPA